MSGTIVHGGDQPEHRCDLPPVPTYEHPPTQTSGFQTVEVLNAVAECSVCGRLYVSREDPDAWGFHLRWVPLRWWHRRARRNLRGARS